VINVENFAQNGQAANSATDVRAVDLGDKFAAGLGAQLGAANKTKTVKELRNVGPSVSYRLRDAAGQAVEYNNYMLPVDMGDGVGVFLLGVRETAQEGFRYLRVPADENSQIDGFMRLRAALSDASARDAAVRAYARRVTDPARPELAEQLSASASRAMGLFAGAIASSNTQGSKTMGLQAVADFLEANVPEAERERASEVLVRILNGVLFELDTQARAKAGVQPQATSGELATRTQAFMAQAVVALGDASLYPAPMVFMLQDFTHVQASVFQLTKAPGKWIVYLGCLLLILGVFAMLYVRERRLWIWITPDEAQTGSKAKLALSSNRQLMDTDAELQAIAAVLRNA
jgi:cytochrome c biogenesis protein